jgi:hypothetical protein
MTCAQAVHKWNGGTHLRKRKGHKKAGINALIAGFLVPLYLVSGTSGISVELNLPGPRRR